MAEKISKKAIDLIVFYEVTSKEYYEKNYVKPEWPGLASGITVGVGYDLGYSTAIQIKEDWKSVLPEKTVAAMQKYAGITGVNAQSKLAQARTEISVPWDAAYFVFSNRDMPKWTKTVKNKLPNTELLSEDCLGVLVSVAYNCGPAFDDPRPKYKEMRNMKLHMKNKEFHKIPAEFVSFKRNWPRVQGLLKRRDAEAKLFKEGLNVVVEVPVAAPVPPKEIVAPPKNNTLQSLWNMLWYK